MQEKYIFVVPKMLYLAYLPKPALATNNRARRTLFK